MEKYQEKVMRLVMSGAKVVYMMPTRTSMKREIAKWGRLYSELKGSTSGKMADYNPDATSIKDLFGDKHA